MTNRGFRKLVDEARLRDELSNIILEFIGILIASEWDERIYSALFPKVARETLLAS